MVIRTAFLKKEFQQLASIKTDFMSKFQISSLAKLVLILPHWEDQDSTCFHTNKDVENTKYFWGNNLHLASNYKCLPYSTLNYLQFAGFHLLTTTR